LEIEVEQRLQTLTHTYTHFRVDLQPFTCKVLSSDNREREDVRWVQAHKLGDVPMGKLDRMLANRLPNPTRVKIRG